jgi:methylmalonyl-CoA/ethylmalonyl-CoA epimerase
MAASRVPAFLMSMVPALTGRLVAHVSAGIHQRLTLVVRDESRSDAHGFNGVPEFTYRDRLGDSSMGAAQMGADPQLTLVEFLRGPSIDHEWVHELHNGQDRIDFRVDFIDEAVDRSGEADLECTKVGRGHGLDGDGRFAHLVTEAVFRESIKVPKLRG